MSERELLQVDQLSIAYGASCVLEDLSFSLSRGRCLGVIGESGAGKTQVFLALMGLSAPGARIRGAATLDGEPLLQPSGAALRGRRIAMIFQDPMTSLTPHLRIGDQIAEPLVEHRGMSWSTARARAAQLLDQVRLTDVERRLRQYPHELSGGMRQRVMIAMALACDPQLLIADEPTTALDVSVQAQILALLHELIRDRQLALALITHDMGVIAALADEVLVLRRGQRVEQGAVSQVFAAPRHEYTRSLLAATPRLEGDLPPASPTGAEVLSVGNLGVDYRLHEAGRWRTRVFSALRAASFGVADGEALGIVGESGCGKSTLARALLRLTPVATGEVVWLGRQWLDLEGESLRTARATVQMVFQDPFASLDPSMTVGECIAEPLRALRPGMPAAERGQRVLRMLADVGLEASFAGRRSPTLSGGQCQRVAIARAMILEPRMLVCDEAVSALDVSVQAQVLELLARLRRERGMTLIFVSHNLAVVRQLCDRILVMYLGQIVEAGPTPAVFARPRHPYTRMLLDAVPTLDPSTGRARLATVAGYGEAASMLDRPAGCAFRLRCPRAVERCGQSSPGPQDAGHSHQVACFRWADSAN